MECRSTLLVHLSQHQNTHTHKFMHYYLCVTFISMSNYPAPYPNQSWLPNNAFKQRWHWDCFNRIWTHPGTLSNLSKNCSSYLKKETPWGMLCKFCTDQKPCTDQKSTVFKLLRSVFYSNTSALADIGKGVKYSLTAGGLSWISVAVALLQTAWSLKTRDTGE